jgi:hypothetical protein
MLGNGNVPYCKALTAFRHAPASQQAKGRSPPGRELRGKLCSRGRATWNSSAKSMKQKIDGKKVDLYTIRNKNAMVVKATNWGAKVQQILGPDRQGAVGE